MGSVTGCELVTADEACAWDCAWDTPPAEEDTGGWEGLSEGADGSAAETPLCTSLDGVDAAVLACVAPEDAPDGFVLRQAVNRQTMRNAGNSRHSARRAPVLRCDKLLTPSTDTVILCKHYNILSVNLSTI